LSLTADGKRLLTGDDQGTAIVWEVPEGKELRRLQVRGWLTAVALSNDGQRAATCEFAPRYATFPNAVRLWDVTKGATGTELGKEFKRGQAAAAFSPDGTILALGQGGEVEGGNGKIFLVDPSSGKKLHELSGHQYGVTGFAFHPDGKHVASGGRDTVVRL